MHLQNTEWLQIRGNLGSLQFSTANTYRILLYYNAVSQSRIFLPAHAKIQRHNLECCNLRWKGYDTSV